MIVGGGAMSGVAYHLAQKGVTDVVLLEGHAGRRLDEQVRRRHPRAVRGRAQRRIALRSMAEFQALDRVSGIDYKRHGYLFLLTNEVDVESFQKALAAEPGVAVAADLPDDVKAMIPALETSDLLAAAYCPIDGHASPESVVQAWAPRRRRVTIVQGTSLDRIAVLGTRSSRSRPRRSASAPDGHLHGRRLVADVGNLAGLDIPVRGEARWMHFTPEDGGLPEELPLTVDFATGFYFHREGEGLVFGGREPTIEGVASHGTRRLPVLADLPISPPGGASTR